ncbi:hypothetical protein L596_017460 [Steinernema carpocapsae]|uniref:Uncharacterized protein n=1 Tax=Steinernema carpocapsae TaxID=34508 RepID=A0A4U5N1Z1_STECR|nr:hypothetical protein L596_017460 [Steinernema carpocapsae]
MDSIPYEFVTQTVFCISHSYESFTIPTSRLWGAFGRDLESHKTSFSISLNPKNGTMAIKTNPQKLIKEYVLQTGVRRSCSSVEEQTKTKGAVKDAGSGHLVSLRTRRGHNRLRSDFHQSISNELRNNA